MAAEYFTDTHFKLLQEWRGKKRNLSDPHQDGVYEELKKAYQVTYRWAVEVNKTLFPAGRVSIRRRPTNQGNIFSHYQWARLYPSVESPTKLAYTVGIAANGGFVVKIDTVGLSENDPLRRAYLELRGAERESPIVAVLPAAEGLKKSFAELVEWSVESIRRFQLRYEDVAGRLGLGLTLSDEDLLAHFDAKPVFRVFRASWTRQEKINFCRLARAVHAAGLDWWHMGESTQLRFGRKNPGNERAVGLLGVIRGMRSRTITWTRAVGEVPELSRAPLTGELVARIETALATESESLDDWLVLESDRPGLWPDELRVDSVEVDDDTGEGGSDEEGTDDINVRRQPINRIFYGPPGTGKTFELSRLLKREYEQTAISMPLAEWRSQFISEQVAGLTWWEGAAAALYDLGGKAKVGQIYEHDFIKAIAQTKTGNNNVRSTLWGTLQHHTVKESTTVNIALRLAPAVFDKTAESVWQFAGDWQETGADLIETVKAYQAGPRAAHQLHRYTFVTFHQSYGYEEFVEGLLPVLDNEVAAGNVRYEIRSGAFKELCQRARSNPDQRYAMVIDEINRGNISKIFGELITLIEADKRTMAEHAISVVLPYSGESFSVPDNVDIIGTMNTADRSLALLDTALRRRFEFVPMMPDARDEAGAPLHSLRVTLSDRIIDLPRMLAVINQRIEALYDGDHCIGHAYFTPLRKVPDGEERLVALQQVFSTRILPLLEEYFFEDKEKISLVLADNQKPVRQRFLIESGDHEDELARLFGSDHGLEIYVTKRRYTIQGAAFFDPDAYIGIYQTPST